MEKVCLDSEPSDLLHSEHSEREKARFCPSPSGLLHPGGVLAALYAFLYAHHHNGHFLLRIEDTDQLRVAPEHVQQLKKDLHWLHLQWDEGPDHDLGCGPYFQSERFDVYEDYYKRLETMGMIYPCFCLPQDLKRERHMQRAQGTAPRYSGRCSRLDADQISELKKHHACTWRFKVPAHQEIVFEDAVRGTQRFQTHHMGDFIIRRSDGTPSFLFCNAIDDALQKVTFAPRGEDHLSNTPRQILILEALGLPVPRYGHFSLIVEESGTPLSKRDGSLSICALKESGILPLALNNYMVRLGHSELSDVSLLSMEELAHRFQERWMLHAPVRFDLEQLLYWQKIAVTHLTLDAFWSWCEPTAPVVVPHTERAPFFHAVVHNILFPKDVHHWARICFDRHFIIQDVARDYLQSIPLNYFETAYCAYEKNPHLNHLLDTLKSTLKFKGRSLFEPMRIALTGLDHGPSLESLWPLIGPEKIKQRLLWAKERIWP